MEEDKQRRANRFKNKRNKDRQKKTGEQQQRIKEFRDSGPRIRMSDFDFEKGELDELEEYLLYEN